MKSFVAYYRVSTQKQGMSGLGLGAQRETVSQFIKGKGDVIAEFTEIESGKNAGRKSLGQAIAFAKAKNAELLVAKLDRLSRDVEFIFMLRNAGVLFTACDLPDCNTLTLGVFASFAQYERERISQRTKDGLRQAKRNGKTLGNPKHRKNPQTGKGYFPPEGIERSLKVRMENALNNDANRQATEIVVARRRNGESFARIASALNDLNMQTRRGKKFQVTTVKRLYDRIRNS